LQHRKTRHIISSGDYWLPLDLRSFLFEYSGAVPSSLAGFAQRMEEALERLHGIEEWVPRLLELREGSEGTLHAWFCRMVAGVMEPLRAAADCLVVVEKRKPRELVGCFHAVEEWGADLEAFLKDVGAVFLEAARAAEYVRGVAGSVVVLRRLRGLRLVRPLW
jgi:hypothetical protein